MWLHPSQGFGTLPPWESLSPFLSLFLSSCPLCTARFLWTLPRPLQTVPLSSSQSPSQCDWHEGLWTSEKIAGSRNRCPEGPRTP